MIFFLLSATLALSFLLGWLIIPHIVRLAMRLHLYDQPDARKVHKKPIPRIGGVSFLPIATVTLAMVLVPYLRLDPLHAGLWSNMQAGHLLAYLCGALLIYVIGLYDDLYTASYRIKFVVQIVAASLLCVSGLWVANFSNVFYIREVPYWLGMPFTVFFVVYVTNAMNLIDGIDGLSSGLSIITLVIMAGLNVVAGDQIWAFMSIAFAGVLCAFFVYNVFSWRNKIFMGDAGSLSLGYTLAFLVLHFWQRDPVWNPLFHNVGLVALSPLVIPLLDVVRVFFVRLLHRRNPFLPDKNHIHHLLLDAGFSARNTLVLILAFSLVIIVINCLVADFISQTIMLINDIFLYSILVLTALYLKKDKLNKAYDDYYYDDNAPGKEQ